MAGKQGQPMLSSEILGEGMYKKLLLRQEQLDKLIDQMKLTFNATKDSIINNQATLLFLNGRIEPFAFALAQRVIEEAEKDLLDLHEDIQNLTNLNQDISEVIVSVNRSRDSEAKILNVEKFINRRENQIRSIDKSSNVYFEEIAKTKAKARLLEHSATALLELKAGK